LFLILRTNNLKSLLHKILVISLFCIYPLCALPFVFIEIYNKKKYAFILLSIFMGLVAYLIAPTGDLYVHTNEYFIFADLTFLEFLDILPFTIDFVYYFVAYIFSITGIPFEFIRFFFVLISYLLVFDIFRDLSFTNKKIKNSKKIYMIFFLICFFQVLFMVTAIGLRYGLAIYLMVYGIYILFQKENSKGWFYILLSCFTHFSMVLILFIILLTRFLKLKKINKSSLFLSLVFIFFGTNIILFFINLFPLNPFLKDKIILYVTGYWGNDFLQIHSFLYRISRLMAHVSVYPLLLFIFVTNLKNKLSGIVLSMSFLLFILYPVANLFYRFTQIILFIFLISFILSYNKSKLHNFFLTIIFITSTFTFLLGSIYTHKRNFLISNEYKILYPSIPFILYSTYDQKWIDTYITTNGDIVGNE
jgi:hypothetical protein